MDGFYCSNDMKQYLREIDTVVFDVDGVLIDTGASFISTIITTTRFYINNELKLDIDLETLSEDDALEFKKYTGFNNDWDLTAAMTAFCLYRSRNDGVTLESFLPVVDAEGGGLDGIEKVLRRELDPETFAWIYEQIDRDRIRRIFQEFYAGEKYCGRLYGFEPGIHRGSGSVETETVLIDNTLLEKFTGKVGILTGRAENETGLALEMAGLTGLDRDLVEYTDGVLPDKPHPAKMERILDRADSRKALFIGDSIDDFLTVVNFNNLGKQRELRFGLIAYDRNGFLDKAQQLSARNVNDLLDCIIDNNNT